MPECSAINFIGEVPDGLTAKLPLSSSREGSLKATLRNGDVKVYRGHCAVEGNRVSVLGITPVSSRPADRCLNRLNREYGLKDVLKSSWAARPLQLVQVAGRPILLLEDPGGEFLERSTGRPMELGPFLRFGLSLAQAVSKAHQRGLVHQDLRPANILLDQISGAVWLTGFGRAIHFQHGREMPEPPDIPPVSLAYVAPERTGRVNRSVDARSDLYSLGIILYQMLTGSLPFAATDPMELVHCHIANKPVPPAERVRTVPGPLSAIVMKLLAKPAEERYQTASGLVNDLRRCLAEWEAHGRIDEFLLGERDVADRLPLPAKLYGRAKETSTLLDCYERVAASGQPELVLISGPSGVGKSSIVDDLRKAIEPANGLFTSGKADPQRGGIPYATLAQSLEALIHRLLGKSEDELNGWRKAIQEALGPHGRLIVDLVPDLELIIGEQPPVPELEPQQAKSRLELIFRRLHGAFARAEHPLVLFLDDLQWLGDATLDLLEAIFTQGAVQNLLVIGAYRDDGVCSSPSLMRKLEAIQQSGAAVREIKLSSLTTEEITELIADSLHCEISRADTLAQLVHQKTAGNPFFVIQFLSALSEEGLLTFDYDLGKWCWDLNRIHAKGYTDNVACFMARTLTRLPVNTQAALRHLACLGHTAKTSMLCFVMEKTDEEVHADLREAVRLELIRRLDGSYGFIHDRVQETAYTLIPEASRAGEHLRIGRLLLAHTPKGEQAGAVFEIVSQLNRGASLMTLEDEREQLATLNLLAGKRARTASAYAPALKYFAKGAALLADDCRERQHDVAFALEINQAECEFLTGRLEAAEERLAGLFVRTPQITERANIACLLIDLYHAQGRPASAVTVGLDYLRHAGIEWPEHPSAETAREEYERVWRALGNQTTADLIALPSMASPKSIATLDVLTRLGLPAELTDINLSSLIICRSINLSLEHGNSDSSCCSYASLGRIAGPRFGDYEGGFWFAEAGYQLAGQRGSERFQPIVFTLVGHGVMPWTRHIRSCRDLLRRAFEIAIKIGDLAFAAVSQGTLISNLLTAGDPLGEVEREAKSGLDFAQSAKAGMLIGIIASQLGMIRTMRGLTRKFGSFDDDRFDEEQFERRLPSMPGLTIALHWCRKMQAHFLAGDYQLALTAESKARPFLGFLPPLEAADYYFYAALTHGHCCDCVDLDQRSGHREAIAAHLRQLEIWAENCPENFEDRAALIRAEIASRESRVPEAEHLYEQAIQSARANGFVHNEALAHELAGRSYLNRRLETPGFAHLREARASYAVWGADGKVRQLDRQYPQLASVESRSGAPGTASTVQHLDATAMVKSSQAVSGEIELPKLLETLMTIALRNAGADRGLLILPRGADYFVEAEAHVSGDKAEIMLCHSAIANAKCCGSVINTVLRTRKSVIVDDASRSVEGSQAGCPPRSLICLPLLRQAKLAGVLYLENSQATHAFARDRIAVLEVLASQAAISLENARLYSDLKDREAKIRRLVDSNIIGITIFTLDGQIVEANDAYLALTGYDRDDLVSERVRWTGMTPPEWDSATHQAMEQLKAIGAFYPFEKEYLRKDGSRIPVLIGGALFEGSRHEGVAFIIDLSERKEAEGRQKLLIEELNHRVKNTLATVLALSKQTFRSAESPEAFREAFEGRLVALSRTHNLLNRSCWTGVSLRDVVEQELAPYSSNGTDRFSLTCEHVRLGPVSAVTLGIAFHELATNSAKYGALSIPDGSVAVSCKISAPGRLRLEWREMGGPPVELPRRRGFGTRLIEEMLPAEINGDVSLDFQPQGLHCSIDIALGRVSMH